MKKKFNKKLYLIFVLLILVIVLIISCEKFNILGPTYIPPETDFRLPEETIPGHIDVNPVPAKDGEVFGAFRRKFRYQGKWYILADYMYEYKPETKTLTQIDRRVILQIDDNANIMIYDKNSKGYSDCYYMNVIEEDRVLYEYYDYGTYSYSSRSFTTTDCKGEEDYHSFITGITFDNRIRTSSDLINWKFEGASNNIYKTFPSVSTDPNASFQGRFGASGYRTVEFKDYIYLIGLKEDFSEQNPSGCRSTDLGPFTVSKDVYYRVYKNKDTSVGANWEKITTPWGQRSSLTIRYDKNKIYITKGLRAYYKWIKSPYWDYEIESFENDNTIWSTTDGVNWQGEPNSSAYDNAKNVSYIGGELPPVQRKVKTPEEPNWIKLNNGRYYKSDNSYETYIINKKTYYVPIPPYEEIKAAYDSGQEYFTITEEHIKTAGLNQFLTKDKEPNKDEDWTVITPIDYTDKLMVWQSGGEKVMLNINNKVIQFIDYYQIELMIKSPPIESYSTLVNYFRDCEKKYREGFYDPVLGYFVTSIREAMYYGAKTDMTEAFMKNYKEYIMPDESLTHYIVEFKY
ncbi:hypothetical protein [Brachyspira pilosicoli]|uniref:hypothetical protein n=1 Tax=Brachyspira pilosicoli TaxID=52584 RepID=UPI0012F50D78|nr:hypothetical protein [Brachyspira pilosicoli]